MSDLAFRTLLYRYFFFGWLFRDVATPDLYARAAAWAHNKRQARWLPTYMLRWVVIGTVMYGLGAACELLLKAPVLSTFFFVPAAISVSINTVIGALIIGFKTLAGPL
jgi:hypothetical protein